MKIAKPPNTLASDMERVQAMLEPYRDVEIEDLTGRQPELEELIQGVGIVHRAFYQIFKDKLKLGASRAAQEAIAANQLVTAKLLAIAYHKGQRGGSPKRE